MCLNLKCVLKIVNTQSIINENKVTYLFLKNKINLQKQKKTLKMYIGLFL